MISFNLQNYIIIIILDTQRRTSILTFLFYWFLCSVLIELITPCLLKCFLSCRSDFFVPFPSSFVFFSYSTFTWSHHRLNIDFPQCLSVILWFLSLSASDSLQILHILKISTISSMENLQTSLFTSFLVSDSSPTCPAASQVSLLDFYSIISIISEKPSCSLPQASSL